MGFKRSQILLKILMLFATTALGVDVCHAAGDDNHNPMPPSDRPTVPPPRRQRTHPPQQQSPLPPPVESSAQNSCQDLSAAINSTLMAINAEESTPEIDWTHLQGEGPTSGVIRHSPNHVSIPSVIPRRLNSGHVLEFPEVHLVNSPPRRQLILNTLLGSSPISIGRGTSKEVFLLGSQFGNTQQQYAIKVMNFDHFVPTAAVMQRDFAIEGLLQNLVQDMPGIRVAPIIHTNAQFQTLPLNLRRTLARIGVTTPRQLIEHGILIQERLFGEPVGRYLEEHPQDRETRARVSALIERIESFEVELINRISERYNYSIGHREVADDGESPLRNREGDARVQLMGVDTGPRRIHHLLSRVRARNYSNIMRTPNGDLVFFDW